MRVALRLVVTGALALACLAQGAACGPQLLGEPERALEVPAWAQGYWNYVDYSGPAVELTSVELLDGGAALVYHEVCQVNDTGESPNTWFEFDPPPVRWRWGPQESIEIYAPPGYDNNYVNHGRGFGHLFGWWFVQLREVPDSCDALDVTLTRPHDPEISFEVQFARGLACYPFRSCESSVDYGDCSAQESCGG